MGPPAFLIGCHRAGTTLARFLLDAHPNIACPPESKFIAALHAFYEYPQALAALESLGCPKSWVRAELRRFAEMVLGGYARAQGKTRWVDKTPNYYRILPFIDEMFEGEARYLFISRHPLDCASSLSAMYDGREELNDPEIARSVALRGKGPLAWCRYWDEVYSALLAFRGDCAERCLVFRYEDLALDTEITLTAILAFLGEQMTGNLVSIAMTMPHGAGYEDAGIRETGRVLRDRIGRWRSWRPGDVDACWSEVRHTACLLGYEIT